jgi:hypothetical protein
MPEFDINGKTVAGYMAMRQRGYSPGVLVQLAAEGFVAFAPHRYSGPTAATIEEADALQRQRKDRVRTEAALVASVEFLSVLEAVVGLGTDNTSGTSAPRIGAAPCSPKLTMQATGPGALHVSRSR